MVVVLGLRLETLMMNRAAVVAGDVAPFLLGGE